MREMPIAEMLARSENNPLDLSDSLLISQDEIKKNLPVYLLPEFDKLRNKIRNPYNLAYLVGTIEFFDDKLTALKMINNEIPLRGEFHHEFSFQKFYEEQFELFKMRDLKGLRHKPAILGYSLGAAVSFYQSDKNIETKDRDVLLYGDDDELDIRPQLFKDIVDP